MMSSRCRSGTIDTPAEGAATEAILANFGWALTRDVDAAAGAGDIPTPTDGSSVIVRIDGAPWGSASETSAAATSASRAAWRAPDDDVATSSAMPLRNYRSRPLIESDRLQKP